MNVDAIRERLCSIVGARRKVRLKRRFPSELPINGFVHGIGREWVLLRPFHDFYPEGFAAIRVNDITRMRSGRYERHWERMLAAEGLLGDAAVRNDMPLDDLSSLLRALQRRGDNVVIECEDAEVSAMDYYIGQILSVDFDSVWFANFDALGRWDDAPHTIAFDEITQVEFETPYVQTFSKYLMGPCPEK